MPDKPCSKCGHLPIRNIRVVVDSIVMTLEEFEGLLWSGNTFTIRLENKVKDEVIGVEEWI